MAGTQSDGTNVKDLIKLPQADKLAETTKAQEAVTKEKVSSWELERLGTALSIGNNGSIHVQSPKIPDAAVLSPRDRSENRVMGGYRQVNNSGRPQVS